MTVARQATHRAPRLQLVHPVVVPRAWATPQPDPWPAHDVALVAAIAFGGGMLAMASLVMAWLKWGWA